MPLRARLAGFAIALLGAVLIAASLRLVPAALHREAARAANARVIHAERPNAAEMTWLARQSRAARRRAGRPADGRRLALVAARRGDLGRAERLLTRTLRHAPGDAVAWTRLAAVRADLGRRQASAAALTRALRAAPSMRHLAGVRAALILTLWPEVRPRVPDAILHRHIRLAAAAAPQRIARIAARTGRSRLVSRARAAGSPRP